MASQCLGSRGCTPGNSRGLHPGQFAAECLRCQFAPMAARFARAHRTTNARPRRSASAVNSRLGAVSYAHACANHQRTCAAQCLRCQFAGIAPRAIRGGVPPLSIRAHGSSLSLVLIEPLAHVRGGVPPLSIRGGCTPGNSRPWQLAIARAHRTTNARARRGLCAVLSPPLGRGPSAAQKRKLGKQRPQARTFPQGAASQAAGRMRPFFQKSCKKPFTFSTLAQYTGG